MSVDRENIWAEFDELARDWDDDLDEDEGVRGRSGHGP